MSTIAYWFLRREIKWNYKDKILVGFILLSLLVNVCLVIPSIKEKIKIRLIAPNRRVLSKIEADITGKNDWINVYKIKTIDTLSIEIHYFDETHSEKKEFQRIVLPERSDGYFHLRGQATNMALADIDKDGNLELVTSAVDDQLYPHIHILKFNTTTRRFEFSQLSL